MKLRRCVGAFSAALMIAAIGDGSATAATTSPANPTGTTNPVSGPLVPLACNPKVRPWTFEGSNNYAAPNSGGRYTKDADGCGSVWWVGSDSTVTLSVQESHCGGNPSAGPCDTTPVTCHPNTVCQLWNPASNNDPFFVFEPYNQNTGSGTLYF